MDWGDTENWNVQRVKKCICFEKKAEAHQENPVVLSLAKGRSKVRDLSKNEGQNKQKAITIIIL